MKFKTTAKAVKAHTDAVGFGYCDVQDIMRGYEPIAYTCGVYGWNADIYHAPNNKTVVTGYRPFGREPRLTFEEVREYERKARELWSNNELAYVDKLARASELRREFFERI